MAKYQPGYYTGHIIDVYAGKAKHGKNSPLITFVASISHKYNDATGQWEEVEQGSREFSTFLTQDTMPYTAKKLKAMGWNPDGNPGNPRLEDLPEDITGHGAGLALVCEHNEKGYEEWTPQCWIDAISGGTGKKEDRVDPLGFNEKDSVNAFFKNAWSAL